MDGSLLMQLPLLSKIEKLHVLLRDFHGTIHHVAMAAGFIGFL